jgi:hypothetical protein
LKTEKTLFGNKLTKNYSLKLCCNECGFPVELRREPVLLKNDIFSLIHYNEYACKSCGHQCDGSTIPVIHSFAEKIKDLWYKKGIEEGRKQVKA